jgi:hypothetical protein
VHLFAIITYLLHAELSPYLFPASVLTAIGLSFLFANRFKIDQKLWWIATVISVLILVVSILLAGFYFDLSWDGQAYHQAAVYNLAGKWNPMFQQLETPDHGNDTSVLFFPKNSWIFGAALLRLFGTVEIGKAYNFIVLFAAFGVVYALFRHLKISATRSVILSILVLLNPVVWSELPGYLNDGDLYLLLVIYLAAVILWLRTKDSIFMLLGIMAVICLVNTKFTGLVFFLVSSLFVLIYVLIKERSLIRLFLLSHLVAGILGVFIFGFNPYVTNMLNRGNPLYPILGSTAFPRGSDTNEKFETPKNMKGKSLPVRLFYANFGQPGNAPYNKETNAKLANPFTTSTETWKAYDFHETRVSGFGPYFGIVLILTLIILPILLVTIKELRLPALLFFIGICCCLSLSKHFWWPRFFPILWLAPLLPLFLLWTDIAESLKRKAKSWVISANVYGWLLAVLMGFNGFVVACIHMKWETDSSIILRTQLEQLRDQKRPIQVYYGAFKCSVEHKLNYWDIKYTAVPSKHSIKKGHKLMSVVKGYPNTVLYCQE